MAEVIAASGVRFLAARLNLPVEDVERSVAFYRVLLGFDTKALMGEPPSFALLIREGAEIALVREENRVPTGCYIYSYGRRGVAQALPGERRPDQLSTDA